MPNPVEGLLEVYEDMVDVLLVLQIPPPPPPKKKKEEEEEEKEKSLVYTCRSSSIWPIKYNHFRLRRVMSPRGQGLGKLKV